MGQYALGASIRNYGTNKFRTKNISVNQNKAKQKRRQKATTASHGISLVSGCSFNNKRSTIMIYKLNEFRYLVICIYISQSARCTLCKEHFTTAERSARIRPNKKGKLRKIKENKRKQKRERLLGQKK
jgi:hypothetical protein